MQWPDPPIVAAIIAALTAGMGAWLTWLASGASRLSARVESLERRIDEMDKAREHDGLIRRLLVSFVDRIGAWVEGGMTSPRPSPDPKLHELIDVAPWVPSADTD